MLRRWLPRADHGSASPAGGAGGVGLRVAPRRARTRAAWTAIAFALSLAIAPSPAVAQQEQPAASLAPGLERFRPLLGHWASLPSPSGGSEFQEGASFEPMLGGRFVLWRNEPSPGLHYHSIFGVDADSGRLFLCGVGSRGDRFVTDVAQPDPDRLAWASAGVTRDKAVTTNYTLTLTADGFGLRRGAWSVSTGESSVPERAFERRADGSEPAARAEAPAGTKVHELLRLARSAGTYELRSEGSPATHLRVRPLWGGTVVESTVLGPDGAPLAMRFDTWDEQRKTLVRLELADRVRTFDLGLSEHALVATSSERLRATRVVAELDAEGRLVRMREESLIGTAPASLVCETHCRWTGP